MKKTTLLFVVLVALLLTTPAVAGPNEPTGEQILLLCDGPFCSGTLEYPANTPFYIDHGWVLMPTKGDQPGQYAFQLELDGSTVDPTYVDHWTEVKGFGPVLYRSWIFNFPQGMSDSHTFVGHWIVPCGLALEYDLVDECENPMADYEVARREFEIMFVN